MNISLKIDKKQPILNGQQVMQELIRAEEDFEVARERYSLVLCVEEQKRVILRFSKQVEPIVIQWEKPEFILACKDGFVNALDIYIPDPWAGLILFYFTT